MSFFWKGEKNILVQNNIIKNHNTDISFPQVKDQFKGTTV